MKKLFFIIFFLFNFISAEDELANAIRKSDLELVSNILKNNVFKNRLKYLNIAKEITETRKIELFLEKTSDKVPNLEEEYFLVKLSFLSIIACLFSPFLIRHDSSEYMKKGTFMLASLGTIGSAIFGGYISSIIDRKKNAHIKKLHDDSYKIYDLIYDYENVQIN